MFLIFSQVLSWSRRLGGYSECLLPLQREELCITSHSGPQDIKLRHAPCFIGQVYHFLPEFLRDSRCSSIISLPSSTRDDLFQLPGLRVKMRSRMARSFVLDMLHDEEIKVGCCKPEIWGCLLLDVAWLSEPTDTLGNIKYCP